MRGKRYLQLPRRCPPSVLVESIQGRQAGSNTAKGKPSQGNWKEWRKRERGEQILETGCEEAIVRSLVPHTREQRDMLPIPPGLPRTRIQADKLSKPKDFIHAINPLTPIQSLATLLPYPNPTPSLPHASLPIPPLRASYIPVHRIVSLFFRSFTFSETRSTTKHIHCQHNSSIPPRPPPPVPRHL